ncbi:MAG TPA: DUF222 domain-containing protein [Galbitalea sp.]|jgi:hypothetical protein|nr:DUF222 domain-containing protein [Galbitalea sp.]
MQNQTAMVIERYETAIAVLAELPNDVAELRNLDERVVLKINGLHARAARVLGAAGAAIAGDLARRSRPELGGDGLARRTGHRTIENLLKATTGATKEQVLTVVKAGTLLVEISDEGRVDETTGEVSTPSQPWLRPVAEAVADGSISTSASQSIGSGLGHPNSAISAEQLEAAARELVARAIAGVDADRLWRSARELRDELDLAGVKIREGEARLLRGLTHHALPTGGGVATWRMDAETYATFTETYDRMTSPKRGGVRFVDKANAAKADRIKSDDRTPAQLASDGFLHLVVAGASVDDRVLLGSGAPVIRITVAEEALRSGVGLARIDGQSTPVSIETAERMLCGGAVRLVGFDPNGHYIEVGEDSRLFSRRQREALAVKFGGCMDPDCDRPPGWCEAHHVLHWVRDGGKTLVENGILLCKFHHLKYHNEGYEIRRDTFGTYWKIPPASIDPEQTPIAMPLKTRNIADLWAAQERAAS